MRGLSEAFLAEGFCSPGKSFVAIVTRAAVSDMMAAKIKACWISPRAMIADEASGPMNQPTRNTPPREDMPRARWRSGNTVVR